VFSTARNYTATASRALYGKKISYFYIKEE